LAGWLDPTETRGYLWIRNKIKGSIRVVKCPYDGLPITLEIKKGSAKFQSYIVNGIPHFTIKATASANITEKGCITEFTNPAAMSALENVLASAINEDIKSTVTAARKLNVDFLDFARILDRQHTNEWHQMSANWKQIFSTAEVDIQVNAKIPEIALLAKSLSPNKAPGEIQPGKERTTR
jgi:spore germination protein KC